MISVADCLRLAEMTAARLCHELSGAMGTVIGALDVASAGAARPAEALDVASEAAGELIARLRLLRTAWGPDPGPLSLHEIEVLLAGMPSAHRVRMDMTQIEPGTVFPSPIGRIVINLAMLAAESIPDTGTVMLAGSAHDLFVRPVSPRAAWPTGLSRALNGTGAAIAALSDAPALQMPLTVLLAFGSGVGLSMLIGVGGGGVAPLRLGGT